MINENCHLLPLLLVAFLYLPLFSAGCYSCNSAADTRPSPTVTIHSFRSFTMASWSFLLLATLGLLHCGRQTTMVAGEDASRANILAKCGIDCSDGTGSEQGRMPRQVLLFRGVTVGRFPLFLHRPSFVRGPAVPASPAPRPTHSPAPPYPRPLRQWPRPCRARRNSKRCKRRCRGSVPSRSDLGPNPARCWNDVW